MKTFNVDKLSMVDFPTKFIVDLSVTEWNDLNCVNTNEMRYVTIAVKSQFKVARGYLPGQ